MNIVTVDNNATALAQLADMVAAILPACHIQAFTDPLLSAKYISSNPVDIVLLTDDVRPANSFKLIRVLRNSTPTLPIVMLATKSESRASAMEENVNGFLVKPVSTEELSRAIHEALR